MIIVTSVSYFLSFLLLLSTDGSAATAFLPAVSVGSKSSAKQQTQRISFITAEATAANTQQAALIEPSLHTNDINGNKGDRDILVRAARGEKVERTPVWLMRQAGRYMAAFREYSDKYPFRQRSETPEMAIELSLQCHRAYKMDGIIMFSDILTPLPVLGIEFDVVKGTGPIISSSSVEAALAALSSKASKTYDFDNELPFIRTILESLAVEAERANTSLIGFVGAPFTLAAYAVEGKSSKHCLKTKKLLMAAEDDVENSRIAQFLDILADMIGQYGCHQIECGAQVIQVFESWSHFLSPKQFEMWAKPAAQKAIRIMKETHPNTPVIYFANGGSSYLELQRDLGADMICIDWAVDMGQARQILGPNVPVSGNLDPTILFGTKEQIQQAVRDCIDKAGGPGKHLLNLGHGVMQGTPEEAVGWLVDECRRYRGKEEAASDSQNL